MIKRLVTLVFILSAHVLCAQSPELIFVFLNKRTDKAELPETEVKKLMDGHLANMARLVKEGKLISAGPFDAGGGIFIFKSNSMEQVKEWLQTDPGIQANRWRVEVLPYFPKLGSACAVGEKYEMVTYQFIRYPPTLPSSIFRMHQRFLKSMTTT